jgi:hypothetical protein
MTVEVHVHQHAFDNIAWVPVPDIILLGHPLRGTGGPWKGAIVLEDFVFPLDITEMDGVKLLAKILMSGNGWSVIVGNECGGPKLEEPVSLFLRKLCLSK